MCAVLRTAGITVYICIGSVVQATQYQALLLTTITQALNIWHYNTTISSNARKTLNYCSIMIDQFRTSYNNAKASATNQNVTPCNFLVLHSLLLFLCLCRHPLLIDFVHFLPFGTLGVFHIFFSLLEPAKQSAGLFCSRAIRCIFD